MVPEALHVRGLWQDVPARRPNTRRRSTSGTLCLARNPEPRGSMHPLFPRIHCPKGYVRRSCRPRDLQRVCAGVTQLHMSTTVSTCKARGVELPPRRSSATPSLRSYVTGRLSIMPYSPRWQRSRTFQCMLSAFRRNFRSSHQPRQLSGLAQQSWHAVGTGKHPTR
ncbi:uncharacterized protein B0H18DRAFT_182860 [Fomitopsis serialis]|uniref:uncharacterized protein n=1 Tax=Fomitopsis serialis TaxID=139415 RepID=UPI00200736BB|nr:uncharacterized protein B0H18DRAFT_182860 [Neoantrodia serialis]KAH9936974.1 hypothetical protein B0H18DRAFT_182860 [Neoantrodia serialis]